MVSFLSLTSGLQRLCRWKAGRRPVRRAVRARPHRAAAPAGRGGQTLRTPRHRHAAPASGRPERRASRVAASHPLSRSWVRYATRHAQIAAPHASMIAGHAAANWAFAPKGPGACPQISIMARPRICPSSSATRASSTCSREYRLVTIFASGNLSSRTHSRKTGKSVSGSVAPRLPQ